MQVFTNINLTVLFNELEYLINFVSTHDVYIFVNRFGTYEDCKDTLCKEMAYKEHFHCMDCNFKVFTKKEEMIR